MVYAAEREKRGWVGVGGHELWIQKEGKLLIVHQCTFEDLGLSLLYYEPVVAPKRKAEETGETFRIQYSHENEIRHSWTPAWTDMLYMVITLG